MREIQGDLWKVIADAKVITTNGVIKSDGGAVMGSGIALQAARRWPDIARTLGNALSTSGNHVCTLGHFSYDPGRELHTGRAGTLPTPDQFELVAFPVKAHWQEQAKVSLIRQSAYELVAMANHKHWERVALPRPGCGSGGLKWETVMPVLEYLLDHRFLIVQMS